MATGSSLVSIFKSHHSGMETAEGAAVSVVETVFKSHHSGMET